jgi:hypothetical protein
MMTSLVGSFKNGQQYLPNKSPTIDSKQFSNISSSHRPLAALIGPGDDVAIDLPPNSVLTVNESHDVLLSCE